MFARRQWFTVLACRKNLSLVKRRGVCVPAQVDCPSRRVHFPLKVRGVFSSHAGSSPFSTGVLRGDSFVREEESRRFKESFRKSFQSGWLGKGFLGKKFIFQIRACVQVWGGSSKVGNLAKLAIL